jgi:hypothetical protein
MLARVSNIEAFRQWREREDQTVEDLVRFITIDEPSEAMQAGTAFHKALETAPDGAHAVLQANGYTFELSEGTLDMPAIRELRAYRQYGGLTVTGQVDGLHGRVIVDHKTTARCDPERYLAGCQWKFYLDIFGANVFRWNIFEVREVEPLVYSVGEPQVLTAYRYPEMGAYCERLAGEYLDFASLYLEPEARKAALAG